MAVLLPREDPPLRRKDDAGEFPKVGNVVCARCAAVDLDVVVVPLQQSSLIEVQRLFCTVARDVRGEADFETTPRFTCLLPWLVFFGFHAWSGKEDRRIPIRPTCACTE